MQCTVWCVCINHCSVAVVTDDNGTQGLMNKCPFMLKTACSESGHEEAMDLACTAQAVLQGTIIIFQVYVDISCNQLYAQ